MRNIWAIVVVAVLVGGVGASLYKLTDDGTSDTRADSAPAPAPVANAATPASDTAQVAQSAPKADADFGKVEVGADELTIGKADAPVTIIEYASLTCSHCARFHRETLPGIKKEFVDTGKVRLVYRDFPLDQLALAAAMVARCAGRERQFGFIDTFFTAQRTWAADGNPIAALGRLARLGGMAQGEFDACLKNQTVSDAVIKQRLEGEKTFKINATPTLIINGKKFSGGLTLEQFRMVVAPMLKKS
ncbi:MAG: DsbA family protein [Alphaproteobacteria bacterium]